MKMARIILAFSLAGLLSCGSSETPASDLHETRVITARSFRVLRVIDGDTFKIMYDAENTSVRIASIDAPELREAGGAEAKAALEELIGGKIVTLEFVGKRKRDAFGRLLADVTVDGVDVGVQMKERGVISSR